MFAHIVIPHWPTPPHLAPNKQQRYNMKWTSSLIPKEKSEAFDNDHLNLVPGKNSGVRMCRTSNGCCTFRVRGEMGGSFLTGRVCKSVSHVRVKTSAPPLTSAK